MSLETTTRQIQRRSFTINQWCEMRGYSRMHFYNMRKTGDAPETIGEGKAQRITDAADARWVKRQETKAKARKAESGIRVAL
jgi:predicted DNA-binding transcriptional regulator AlpA